MTPYENLQRSLDELIVKYKIQQQALELIAANHERFNHVILALDALREIRRLEGGK